MGNKKEISEELENEVLEEEYEEVEYTGPSGLSLALNRYFHHLDRGGSLGGEILAGMTMFFLSICMIFMNIQLVGNVINADVVLNSSPGHPGNIAAASVYTELYVGSILVAIIGSLVTGLVAKLPFTQISTMGFASSLLCLVGTGSGLTWQNLLFINLIAGGLYVVVSGVPAVRKMLYEAIPEPVRKAFPAALGLMMAWFALQMTGLITTLKIGIGSSQYLTIPTGLALGDLRSLALCGLVGGAAAGALYALMCVFKRKHRVFWPMMGGTLAFIALSIAMNGIDTARTESFINFGRVWLVAGSQASPQTPFADSFLTYSMDAISAVMGNLGAVFTEGMDFSGYTGNTLALMIGGVLCYLFAGLFQSQGAIQASQEKLNEQAEESGLVALDTADSTGKALLCGAVTSVLASFFGVAGVSFGIGSVASTKDNAKSGIASIVSCIGFAISLFVMAFPALFATVTYPVSSMNTWNYFAYGNGGIIYLIQGVVFTVVDAVIICVGVNMAISLKKLNWKKPSESVSAVLTVIAALASSNLVIGALIGCVSYLILSLIQDRKAVKVSMLLLTVLLAIVMVLL